MIKRIGLLMVAVLLVATVAAMSVSPAFAAQTGPNKKEVDTKKTPHAVKGESGQTDTFFRHGNTITLTKNAGKSPPKADTCTQQEFRAGDC